MKDKSIYRTVLKIKLDALTHNLNCYRQALLPSTRIMAMVKADAYGSGLLPISRHLASQGIDYLGVAYIDEGIQLRNADIDTPIQVFVPDMLAYKTAFRHNLELSINSLDDLNILAVCSADQKLQCPVHINLDTGMHRLGITPQEIPELLNLLDHNRSIRVISLFSHLAAADHPEMDDYTQEQISRFEMMTQNISSSLPQKPWRHLLNSAGIRRFHTSQYDMVRIGIGLYGVHDIPVHGRLLLPVHSLQTHIIALRNIQTGQSVGYSRKWYAQRPSIIATIPLGYADGIFRQSGIQGAQVKINDSTVPIIGLVSMDTAMLDVSDLHNVQLGQPVQVFGQEHPISLLAQANKTIPYEILSRISSRAHRIYQKTQ